MQAILGMNWKTTLGGLGILLAALAKVATDVSQVGFRPEDVSILFGGFSAAYALWNAKDANVIGAGATAKTLVLLLCFGLIFGSSGCMTTTTTSADGTKTVVQQLDVAAVAAISSIAAQDLPSAIQLIEQWKAASQAAKTAKTQAARDAKLQELQTVVSLLQGVSTAVEPK